jgi:hypothetical protein
MVSVILDADTGAVLRVESLDPAGARRELTDEDRARLAGRAQETIEAIVERAFEAGIACVLGQAEDETADGEDAEDEVALERLLLRPLMHRSGARRLLRREVLDRAALASLIRHASAGEPGAENRS